MGTLLLIVDAWFELAHEAAPERFQPADRVEVLGLLVQLISRRFHGLRRVPTADEVRPVLERDSVGLVLRTNGRAPAGVEVVERRLVSYGFTVSPLNGSQGEVLVACSNLAGARVLVFPDLRAHRTKG
ncbi:MAG: hypothetical protein A2289_23895 [Deltaproteobacteria bacterium RIFOXYA12_FULL_58_15]|nr:MAG: hypothetical protein A2289_23895 [Deltaproteobacteria bacterium RIFOXYA12_FULL_58_15]OGR08106.1 MAG: hypothetical protein A2341_20670 [Deltaproteobacteria bacterium RIFOXYB12_FULL_58_9]